MNDLRRPTGIGAERVPYSPAKLLDNGELNTILHWVIETEKHSSFRR